jgi:pimeloyl-ACP methyl ester carboxylesterase
MSAQGHYADINGLKLYYEIHGAGRPLVLIHGGGSTIESNWSRVLPAFAKSHKVVAVELQAHGHTKDIDRALSFEQDADDVAAVLVQLGIAKADFMGFSNGGTTCLQIGIRHPEVVNKLVVASATYKLNGMPPGFFDGFPKATLRDMPMPLQEAYLKANPDPKGLQRMFERDVARMMAFKDIPDDKIKSIQSPVLIINGDRDVTTNEHALEMSRTLPHARLVIVPSGHGDYIGESCSVDKKSTIPDMIVAMVDNFLKE